MHWKLSATIVGLAAGALLPSPARAQVPQSFSQKILVPAYFQPGDLTDGRNGQAWDELANSSAVGAIIFNPYNGPADPSYLAVYGSAIAAARTAGKKVIGYVHTDYTARSLSAVLTDIDNYYSWYVDGSGNPIVDGIFVDEVQMRSPHVDYAGWQADQAYYSAIRDQVKGKTPPGFLVVNPGTSQHGSIADVSDVVINYEGLPANFEAWSPPQWQADLDPSRVCALVHAAASADIVSIINRSKSYNLGWIYVTTDAAPNPWDTLPGSTDWSAELTQVGNSSAQVVPTALVAASAANDTGHLVFTMQQSFIVPNLTSKWRRVLLDTDLNVNTGKPSGGIGADYLIENSWYYSWNATTSSWTSLGSLTPNPNTATDTSWRISRANIGNVTSAIRVKLEIEEGSVSPARRRTSATIQLPPDNLPPVPYAATNDATKIYYSLTVAGSFSFRRIFIDTDQNASTGYAYGGVGANYLIENGSLYQHSGSGWSWSYLGSSNQSCTGDTCTWNILRSAVGETQSTGEATNLVMRATGSSPQYLSPAFTHTFTP